ncbi:MAG: prolyl oligopeptidase family serine peptidase, partial [Emcibacteraceae bacterium]|nr:prolyl oligopeptidase family serine peptidase [Emcibacteraceae bacterium]
MRWDGENALNPIPPVNRKIQPQFQASVVDFLVDDPDHVLIQIDVDEMNAIGVQKLNIKRQAKKYRKVIKGRAIISDWKNDLNNIVRFGAGASNIRGKEKIRSVAYFRKSENSTWNILYDVDLNKEDIPFEFIALTEEPSVIFVLISTENGNKSLVKYDIEKQLIIEKVSHDDNHDVVYVDVNDRGVPEWYRYHAEKQGVVYLDDKGKEIDAILSKSFPDQNISIYSKTADGKKIVFKVNSPQEPGTYYMLDMNLKKIVMLDFNYKNADIAKLSEMKPITYTARDGLEIPGYLSLPVGKEHKNLPTVIFPHWGPDHRDNWGFDYNVQYLTSLGYAVLQMNYRGSTGYGVEYLNLGKHQWGDKILNDINDGTKWAIEQGYADPNNICIMGDTYGGYAALQAIVKEQSLYKCSIAH